MGVSNALEIAAGSDPFVDEHPPVITLNPIVRLVATGQLTAVPDLGVTAVDGRDGVLSLSVTPGVDRAALWSSFSDLVSA